MLGMGMEQRREGDAEKLQSGRCLCFPLPAKSSPFQGTQWALSNCRKKSNEIGRGRGRGHNQDTETTVSRGSREGFTRASGGAGQLGRELATGRRGRAPHQRGAGAASSGNGPAPGRSGFSRAGLRLQGGGRAGGGSRPRRRDFPGVEVGARRSPGLSNFPGQTGAGTTLRAL